MLRHVGLLSVLISYVFLGGLLFHTIERPVEVELEERLRNETERRRNQLVQELLSLQHSCALENSTEECTKELTQAIVGYERHLDNVTNSVPKEEWKRWGYMNAVFYSGALITTIGYGNVVCRTRLGRGMTILYSIIGFPLLIFVLRLLGKTTFVGINWTWQKCKRVTRRLYQRWRGGDADRKPSRTNTVVSVFGPKDSQESIAMSDVEEQVPLALAFAICVAYLLIVTAIYNALEEEWDYLTTMYFIFVTISTIGLGDFVPRYTNSSIVLLGVLVIGLSLVSMCISATASRFEKHYLDGAGRIREFFENCFGTKKVAPVPHASRRPSNAATTVINTTGSGSRSPSHTDMILAISQKMAERASIEAATRKLTNGQQKGKEIHLAVEIRQDSDSGIIMATEE